MPQRRAAAGRVAPEGEKTIAETNLETSQPLALELQQGSLSLDDSSEDEEKEPLSSMDEVFQSEKHSRRIKRWKDSPFAVGLTEPTWMEERFRGSSVPYDESGCLCCSAQVCPLFGAARVGNMAVLKSSMEWVETVVEDEETGEQTIRRVSRPKLDIVVGPYWPMLFCVTYPLIFGVSGWTFMAGIYQRNRPLPLIFVWIVFTVGLIVSLGFTAFRDPGILRRVRNPPPQHANTWRWTDQADSYRPRNAWFDQDTAVVVEGFDHT
jgi:hypothetical protein